MIYDSPTAVAVYVPSEYTIIFKYRIHQSITMPPVVLIVAQYQVHVVVHLLNYRYEINFSYLRTYINYLIVLWYKL